MSTSSPATAERIVDNKFAKRLIIVNALVPAALLVIDAARHDLGVNDINFAIRTTGLVGLVLLVFSLLITPLRKLTGWQTLIAVRRNLGVIGFGYIAAHFLIFWLLDQDGSLRTTLAEIIDRPYLWFGFGALLLMTPLAITSTDGMVRRLGGKRWKLLHRLAYPAIIAGSIHYLLLVKSDIRQPAVFAGVLGVALAYRVVARLTAKPKPKKVWSGELKIGKITDETHDVRTFRFVNPSGGPLPFKHTAGQYLSLKLSIDGKPVNRSYTIASGPNAEFCEISVKRAANGFGSAHLHATWKQGDLVKITAPAGKFTFSGAADRVVLLAGGIGITPMMSVIRAAVAAKWDTDLYLVYSVRAVKDIAFRAELEELQNKHPRLRVKMTVSGDPDTEWHGARGNITRELLTEFVPSFATSKMVMCCGPDPMMTAMRALVTSMGVPDEHFHQEAFISPTPRPADMPSDGEDPPLADGQTAVLTFARSSASAETAELTVLEAAEEAGVEIPYECRSGVCGQCKTKLLSGKVRMDSTDALTPADRTNGLILACQARATRDCVIDA